MAKDRKVIVNTNNEEVEEGDPDSAFILSLDVAEERGVKLLKRKKAAPSDAQDDEVPETTGVVIEVEAESEAKAVDAPAENKAVKSSANKGR